MTVGDLLPQRVELLKINGAGRVDAFVVIGSMKTHLVLPVTDSDIAEAIENLHNKIIRKARENLVEQLEMDLSPSTRKALST